MSYSIFLDIHIFSYMLWLVVFGISLYLFWAVKRAEGTDREKALISRERKITMMGTHTAILGILISGGAMVSMPSGPQWGWFNFSAHAWLATKQTIFVVILILAFIVSTPVEKKLRKMLKAHQENKITTEQRNLYHKAWRLSAIVFLLVVINTYLGLYRP